MQWAEESLKIIIEISEISLTIKQDYSLSFLSDDSVTGTRFVHPLEATKNLKKIDETDLQTLDIRQHWERERKESEPSRLPRVLTGESLQVSAQGGGTQVGLGGLSELRRQGCKPGKVKAARIHWEDTEEEITARDREFWRSLKTSRGLQVSTDKQMHVRKWHEAREEIPQNGRKINSGTYSGLVIVHIVTSWSRKPHYSWGIG